MITINKFAKEIRKQFLRINKDKQCSFNFLGFVEMEDLTDEVESHFEEIISGRTYYVWVNGNRELQEILKGINIKTKWQDIEKLLLRSR